MTWCLRGETHQIPPRYHKDLGRDELSAHHAGPANAGTTEHPHVRPRCSLLWPCSFSRAGKSS